MYVISVGCTIYLLEGGEYISPYGKMKCTTIYHLKSPEAIQDHKAPFRFAGLRFQLHLSPTTIGQLLCRENACRKTTLPTDKGKFVRCRPTETLQDMSGRAQDEGGEVQEHSQGGWQRLFFLPLFFSSKITHTQKTLHAMEDEEGRRGQGWMRIRPRERKKQKSRSIRIRWGG